IRVIEFVGVANPFVRSQFNVRPAEGMTLARREIRERHFVSAANLGVNLVHLSGESVWRKPFGHRVRIEKGLVNFFGCRSVNAVVSSRLLASRRTKGESPSANSPPVIRDPHSGQKPRLCFPRLILGVKL